MPDYRIIANKAGTSGIVLALDLEGLVWQARNADGMIEFVPQVGDFVAADEPPELRKQLELLDRAIEGHYAFAEDRALARIPDPQGWEGR